MVRRFGKRFVNFLFPIYEAFNANKKLNADIEELKTLDRLKLERMNSYYMNQYEKLSEDNLLKFLNQTFEKKKSLEDKAKVNVFGITIAVTLITGLYKVLLDGKTVSLLFNLSISLLALYSIGQMILAGLSSLKVLGDVISQYELFPDDMLLSEEERCHTIALDTEINVKLNTVRNNFISSSYSSMKKSLVGLFVLFFLITIPTITSNSSPSDQISKSLSQIQETEKKLSVKVDFIEHTQTVQDGKTIDNQGEILSLNKELEKISKELKDLRTQIETINLVKK